MRYFSLFSGIGGFELGIQQAYEEKLSDNSPQGDKPNINTKQYKQKQQPKPLCVGYSEIDKYATQIYQRHFPTHKNYGDITKVIASEIPDHDLLIAGFPCQSFSIAGKRGGFKDTRGTLFFEIARIAKAKRPPYLLLENVKGLLNHDKGNTFATIISTLDELGYDCQWSVLNSKNFGVPQNRERVFIVGHLRGASRPKVFPIGETTKANYRTKFPNIPEIGEAIRIYKPEGIAPPTKSHHTLVADFRGDEGLRVRKKPISPTLAKRKHSETDISTMPPLVIPCLTPDRPNKRQHGRRFKEAGEPSFTLTGQDIHGISDGVKIRRLTPTECERLQGFPDGWTKGVSDTQRYKTLGNAVTVNVVREIIKALTNQ